MATGLVEGAVAGLIVAELLKIVKSATTSYRQFKPILEDLESTLNSISPLLKEIEELSCSKQRLTGSEEQNNEMKPLLDLLEMGKKLVEECSKISKRGIYQKIQMSRQLKKFKTKMFEFFHLYLTALSTRNTLQVPMDVVDGLCRRLKDNRLSKSMGLLDPWEAFEEPVRPVGLDQPLKELKRMLFTSKQVIHVLSAPGGSGKTTLAKMLSQDDDVKGEFGTNIFAATVTKTPNVMVIIQTILEQMQNQCTAIEVPNSFQSEKEAFVHFKKSVEKITSESAPPHGGSGLCILDDVWSGSKMELFLDNFELQVQGRYKVLVTSRYAFPRFEGSTYRLKMLSDEDALKLFNHSAFSESGKPIFIRGETVNEIVRKCKNNPLVLKVIGRSLRGEPAEEWKVRKEKLSNYIFETENEVIESLEASLDALGKDDVLKNCFFDLASFPEDSRIDVPALVDMWMELYDKEASTVMSNINELSNRCLVDLAITRKDGRDLYWCYNDRYITQHDILRELAMYLSKQGPVEQWRRLIIEISGNSYPKWLAKHRNCQTSEARLLSISTDEKFKSKWWDWDMDLSLVEVLILNLSSRQYSLPEFVDKLGQLKALIIMNHGHGPTEVTNFQTIGSASNLTRIYLKQVVEPPILQLVTPLKNLKKISLVMCSIGEAFNNCPARLSDILPGLEEIDVDYCNDLTALPCQICDLRNLTQLSITNCPKLEQLPDRIGDLGATLQVLCLSGCIELKTLPDSINSLHNLDILDISECLSLTKLPEVMGDMKDLRELHMRRCKNVSKLLPSIISLPCLKDVFCDEEMATLLAHYGELQNVTVHVLAETFNLRWLR